MTLIISILIGIFLYLCSSLTNAQSYGSKLCKNTDVYACYKVKRNDTWPKLFPDEEQRDLIMRINRTNNALHSGMILAIPKNTDTEIDILDYAPFNRQIDITGGKLIIVSLDKLAFGAYNDNGELTYWGPISAGKGYCPDLGRGCHTARGNFKIYRKLGADCVSSKFPVGHGGAPMPYCMFFKGGFALHGSYDVPGYHASHGCVRLFVKDAKWLNQEFVEEDDDVSVIVK